VTTRDFRSLGTITLDARNFLKAHPALVHDIAGYSLAHILYSHVRISRLTRPNRRQLRKLRNRRRRWFVDNIIMHHKRIHDRNREMTIQKARQRILEREKERQKGHRARKKELVDTRFQWRNAVLIKERGAEIRGRIDARKSRAKSRWATLYG